MPVPRTRFFSLFEQLVRSGQKVKENPGLLPGFLTFHNTSVLLDHDQKQDTS
jgi:hypothetical protein